MSEKRGVPSETIQQIRERIDIVDLIRDAMGEAYDEDDEGGEG